MKIVKAPSYKCQFCNKIHSLEINDFGEPERRTEKRNMGYEVQFVWTVEFSCLSCEKPLEITIEGFEYPEGFLNYSETSSEGCIITEKAELESDPS